MGLEPTSYDLNDTHLTFLAKKRVAQWIPIFPLRQHMSWVDRERHGDPDPPTIFSCMWGHRTVEPHYIVKSNIECYKWFTEELSFEIYTWNKTVWVMWCVNYLVIFSSFCLLTVCVHSSLYKFHSVHLIDVHLYKCFTCLDINKNV